MIQGENTRTSAEMVCISAQLAAVLGIIETEDIMPNIQVNVPVFQCESTIILNKDFEYPQAYPGL